MTMLLDSNSTPRARVVDLPDKWPTLVGVLQMVKVG